MSLTNFPRLHRYQIADLGLHPRHSCNKANVLNLCCKLIGRGDLGSPFSSPKSSKISKLLRSFSFTLSTENDFLQGCCKLFIVYANWLYCLTLTFYTGNTYLWIQYCHVNSFANVNWVPSLSLCQAVLGIENRLASHTVTLSSLGRTWEQGLVYFLSNNYLLVKGELREVWECGFC